MKLRLSLLETAWANLKPEHIDLKLSEYGKGPEGYYIILDDGKSQDDSAEIYSKETDHGDLTEEGIRRRFNDVLIRVTGGSDPDTITPMKRFNRDFELDSLDTVELIMNVEDEFGIEIPDEDAEKIVTVQDAYEYLYKRL